MSVDFDFVKAVLGEEAAEVLIQAVKKSDDLGQVLVPRTVLAWVSSCDAGYEGCIPGTSNTFVKFTKSEVGGYTGSITIGEELYSLKDSSVFEAVAAVASALDIKPPEATPRVRNQDLEKLGKSIDLMAKTKRIGNEIAKSKKPCPKCNTSLPWKKDKVGFHLFEGKMCDAVKSIGKTESFGPKHAPRIEPPTPPTSAAPPPAAPMKPARPKTKKLAQPKTVYIGKDESQNPCPACGQQQFKNQSFHGCVCLRTLSKSVEVLEYGERIVLRLNSEEWDEDAIATLFDNLGRNDD